METRTLKEEKMFDKHYLKTKQETTRTQNNKHVCHKCKRAIPTKKAHNSATYKITGCCHNIIECIKHEKMRKQIENTNKCVHCLKTAKNKKEDKLIEETGLCNQCVKDILKGP